MKIPTPTSSGIPGVMAGILRNPSGLILVTGPTGSGKSTTMASMIDTINRNRPCHIVTIEDPIEYLHTQPDRPPSASGRSAPTPSRSTPPSSRSSARTPTW